MLYILLGAAFGVFICYGLVKDYIQMHTATKRFLENGKDYVKQSHTAIFLVFDILGAAAAVWAAFYGAGYFGGTKDDLTTALAIALIFMFIGQYLVMTYRASYYENETSIITCGKQIRYKSVKKLEYSTGMQRNFSVTTFNGENVQITKQTAKHLSEKTGIQITPKKR